VVIQGARVFGAKLHASEGTGALSPEVGPTGIRFGPILLQVFLFLFLPEPNNYRKLKKKPKNIRPILLDP
jgi:hypothetical protein